MLAYASDFTLLDTALIAHGKLLFDTDIQLASLDHALWFHRPFRADDWLLYAQDSPSAHGARGFCRGSVYHARWSAGRLGRPGRPDAAARHGVCAELVGRLCTNSLIICASRRAPEN